MSTNFGTKPTSSGLYVDMTTGAVQTGHTQFRNRIINGDMRINQRGTSTYRVGNGGINGAYTGDRWKCWRDTTVNGGYFNISFQVVHDLQYHSNAMLLTNVNTGTGSSPAWNGIAQIVEGYNIVDLNWGKSYAYPLTVSFWAKSSIPGAYGIIGAKDGNGSLGNNIYGGRYFINNSNTWQYVTHTISPPPIGVQMENTNLAGISIMFTFANMDETGLLPYRLPQDGWSSSVTNCWAVPGQISWATMNNATFQITGVQLEKGTQATPFEFRPYALELQLCMRYFIRLINHNLGVTINTQDGYSSTYTHFMRANPSVDTIVSSSYEVAAGSAGTVAIRNQLGARNVNNSVIFYNSAGNWSANTLFNVTCGLTAEL